MSRRRQSGHALMELAFSATIMATCLAGTFQYGYTFYVYDQLVSAVGNAGRYAASRTIRAASPEDLEKGKAAVRNMAVFGDPHPDAEAVPIAPDLKPENVQISFVAGDRGSAPMAVDVAITNYTVHAVFGAVTLNGRPAVEFPFVGRYTASESEP